METIPLLSFVDRCCPLFVQGIEWGANAWGRDHVVYLNGKKKKNSVIELQETCQ